MKKLFLVLSCALALLPLSVGFSREKPAGAPPLVFVLPPVEDISIMYEKFLPLKVYLEQATSQ
nr:hypothetical protein [Nitrospiraceae bacterium]